MSEETCIICLRTPQKEIAVLQYCSEGVCMNVWLTRQIDGGDRFRIYSIAVVFENIAIFTNAGKFCQDENIKLNIFVAILCNTYPPT